MRTIEKILDLARWAPSGDNTQPWRFEIKNDLHVVVHGFDTRDHCVYDLDGHPSQISLGALLETIAVAATGHHLRSEIVRRRDSPDTRPVFDVRFVEDAAVAPDSLIAQITLRSVQRRPMQLRGVTGLEKQQLEAAVGPAHQVVWLEGLAIKLRMARLLFQNAKLRLTMPEAYEVHRDIIQWGAKYSEDRVPDQALGVDRVSAGIMRWAMRDWQRVNFLNRFLAGTLIPRIQMDLLPALFCAGHFLIISKTPPHGIDEYIAAGRATQRFWLALTRLGLVMQPEMTPLIFSRYVHEGIVFSHLPGLQEQAVGLSASLSSLVGKTIRDRAVFMGRLGEGAPAQARSTRLKLSNLLIAPPTSQVDLLDSDRTRTP